MDLSHMDDPLMKIVDGGVGAIVTIVAPHFVSFPIVQPGDGVIPALKLASNLSLAPPNGLTSDVLKYLLFLMYVLFSLT